MKLLLSAALLLLVTAQRRCGQNERKETPPVTCYKGRLEIKALCSNYTIRILDGPVDTALVAARWTDESTGKSYTNVFALGSPCTFPQSLNAGDEFYFTVGAPAQNCAVCKAFYPTPPKRLSITVLDKPCP